MIRRSVWRAGDLLARPTASWRSLPDYLIVGAQRAGTTSLQQVLTSHPDVVSPRWKKGVHYFDQWFDRGPNWYRSQFRLDLARKFHEGRTGAPSRTGEASPYYLFHPAIPERIAALIPDVRLIALLRDPVERALSQYKHEVRRGFEDLELREALEAEDSRLAGEEAHLLSDPHAYSFSHQHHSYVARGRYAEQIRRYLDVFGRDRLLVLEAETFWEEPEKTLARVLDFLDLRPWHPVEYPRVNATKVTPIDDDVRRFLADRFDESNAELSALVGQRFRWM